MDEVETELLQTQRFKPLVWLRFIDDMGLISSKLYERTEQF